MGSYTTLLSVKNIYILSYFLDIIIGIGHYTIVCQEYLHFILFLKYNELGSDTTLLSVRNIYILFYFLNIMKWDRTLHYCLSRIFTFYLIS